MSFRVEWRPAAESDLKELYDWLASVADADTAQGYVDRLIAFAQRLEISPHRGTPRSSPESKLRSVTFERRRIVVYRVSGDAVVILGLIDARMNYDAQLLALQNAE